LTKEEAAYLPPKRGQQVVLLAPRATISLHTLRENEDEAGREEGRHRRMRETGVRNDKMHRDDHVRLLFDPSDPLGRSIHGDTFRPAPNCQRDHRPSSLGTSSSSTTYRGDHVGLLLHDPPLLGEQQQQQQQQQQYEGRKGGKGGVAFHFTLRGSQDICVANLINGEKARKLPVPNLLPFQGPKARLGLFMRSGDAVREALHQESAHNPSSLPPSLYTTYSRPPAAVREGGREEGRPEEHSTPYRRPQYLDVREDMQQHLAAAAAAAAAAGGPGWHPSPSSSARPSTPSSVASSLPSSSSSFQESRRPIDRTPLPPSSFPSFLPPSSSSSCSSSVQGDDEHEAAFLSQQVGGEREGGREGGRGGFDGSSRMSMAASVGSYM